MSTEPDSRRAEIERLTQHPLIRGSEALCQLLRYLSDRSLNDPDTPVREHQIAADVFGRPSTFDPRTDSTVRVQTSRLRSKLTEYYATTGREDAWQIEIPKGSYSVVFHAQTKPEPPIVMPLQAAPVTPAPTITPEPVRRPWSSPVTIALALLAVLLGSWGILYLTLRTPDPGALGPATTWFWKGLLRGSEEPLVIFSNAEFVGRPETGIRYRKPGEPAATIFDQYTGVGEVFAIHDLDRIFNGLRHSYILNRGRLLNWDDAKGRELVFVGSPSENLPLRDLPVNRDFTFGRADSGPRAGDLGIENLRPRPGEQKIYLGSPNVPIAEDYAVLELGWTDITSRPVLLLAGTTTFGTEAAVEFACNEGKLREVRRRLNNPSDLPAFSAILHVQVRGGVPLDTTVVALRRD